MRDLRHLRSPLFLSFFLLFGHAMNLQQFITTKDSSGAPSRKTEKQAAFVGSIWRILWIGAAFASHCYVTALQMRTPKDAALELGHNWWSSQRVGPARQTWPDPQVRAEEIRKWGLPFLYNTFHKTHVLQVVIYILFVVNHRCSRVVKRKSGCCFMGRGRRRPDQNNGVVKLFHVEANWHALEGLAARLKQNLKWI